MSNVSEITGTKPAPKAVQTRMETQIITPESVAEWQLPTFQREFRNNGKVKEHSELVKATEHVMGVITLGILRDDMERLKNGTAIVWLVDGQHRIEGFKMSGMQAAFADVRVMIFEDKKEMAKEYYRLNDPLVKMRPDDKLRSMEEWLAPLAKIRKHCEFVGYGQIRRNGGSSAILSMSALVRCWTASQYEVPTSASGGAGASGMAEAIDDKGADNIIAFLNIAYASWGRDHEYGVLWNNLNLTVCMWLWHKLVMDRDRSGGRRYVTLNAAEFKRCLMAVSTGDYVEWLKGRGLTDRDRSPCYGRLKSLFINRLVADKPNDKKPMMPQPAWASWRQ